MPRKRLLDLERSPTNVTYGELLAVLAEAGWSVREGTRHGAIATGPGGQRLTIPRPHGSQLKAVYVRAAVKMIKGAE